MQTFSVSQEPLVADEFTTKLAELKTTLQKKYMTTFEDSFSEEVWAATYKDHTDETVNDTMFRVAAAAASMEKTDELKLEWTEKFYDLLSNFKATAGGRIYANAGTEWKGTTLMNCLAPETLIHTDRGILEAKDIPVGSLVNVLTTNGRYESALWNSYGKQRLYAVTFQNGETIYATEGHEWVVSKQQGGVTRVTTKMLPGRSVELVGIANYCYKSLDDYRAGVKNGLVFGDGYKYTDFNTGKSWSALQQFGDSRHLILDHFGYTNVTFYKGDPEGIHYVSGLPPSLKNLPDLLTSSQDYLRGFLAGAIAADGFVDSNGSVGLHTANYDHAVLLRRIAISAGIPVTALRVEREGKKYSQFATENSKLYRLTFVKRYFQQDPLLILKNAHRERMIASPESTNRPTIKCITVDPTDRVEEVYCCDQPTTHTLVIGESGILTGNCYVGPRVKHDADSLPGIFSHLLSQAHTLKSEGGWGENFSYIRPRGSFIHGIGVETPGAVKYMELFDKSSEIITSGSGKKSLNKKAKGKIRKGAMMGVMDVWHPDIIEFITAKQQPGRLTKFNVSVNCTDEFMEKVVNVLRLKEEKASEAEIELADQWNLRFPDTTFKHYKKEWDGNLKAWEAKGYPVKVFQTISALWLWNLIMESTYNRAEPGVLFLDRANYFLPLNYAETVFATNPCGEQTLAPGGVCNLASLNLTQFVNKNRTGFDLKRVEQYTRYLVRFLDNINDLTNAPLPEYEFSIRNKRRIGIGILGWGSALYMLKTRFASGVADLLRDEVMRTIARTAYMASIDLAEEKGMFSVCEPKWHKEGPFVKSLELPEEYMQKLAKTGIRNSSLLSIQPTGNTSIFANVVSGGLEPVFLHEYIRTVIVNTMPEEIADVCPKWYEGAWHETKMFKFAKEGDEEILKGTHEGTVYKIDKNRGLTKEVLCEDYGVHVMKRLGEWDANADWAATALGMNVQDHVSDLKGFARWVDSAMSKTVNVPNDYSFEKFKDIYLDAYKSGYVKGVTTYRSGTMTTVLAAKDEKNADPSDEEIIRDDVKMPDSAPASMKTLKAEGKKWYMTVVWNETQTRPFALFVQTNAHEKNVVAEDAVEHLVALARRKKIPKRHIDSVLEKISSDNNSTKIARMISLCLRHGVLIKNIVSTLDKTEAAYAGSFVFAVKKWLSTFIKDGEKVEGACLECGSNQVVFREGCSVCLACGSSKCG